MQQQSTIEVVDTQPEGIPQAETTTAQASPASEETPSRDVKKKRVRAMVIAPAAILVLAVTTAFLHKYYAGWESTDDAYIDGYINPISSRVAGYITRVYVDDNQFVKAGTLLVQIDPKDYQVSLDSARATLLNDQATARASEVNVPITAVNTSSELASAHASKLDARAGVSAAEKQLIAARAAQEQAEADSSRAQDDVNRYKQLVEKEEISEQQFTRAVQVARAAAAAVTGAKASVQAAEDHVTQAKGILDQAEARVEAASTGPQRIRVQKSRALAAAAIVAKSLAAVERARLNLSYTRIVAPVDGIVARRSAQTGQYVTPGQPLMAIVPLDDIWVTANFKETQLGNVRIGNPASIHVDAFDRDYSGRVESIAGGTGAVFSLLPPENATGNYVKVVQRVPVRIRIDDGQDPQHRLRPGLSVEPKVRTD
jgi:membrane fusion protein (multidrug efflux system)